MDVCLTIRGGIKCTLYEMFLHWGTSSLGILVEEQQTLGQLTIVQTFSFQHIGSDGFVFAFSDKSLDAFALVLLTNGVEGLIEGKLLDTVEVFLFEIGGGHVVVGIDKSKHVLEHTAGGTRSRHELYHTFACCFVLFPSLLVFEACLGIGGNDTMSDTGGCFQLQERESGFELIQLILDLLLGNTLLSDLFQVFF